MKRISHLLKEWKKMLVCPFNTRRPIDNKKLASELEKECLNCSKKKDIKFLKCGAAGITPSLYPFS
jgi:hypothetical protein